MVRSVAMASSRYTPSPLEVGGVELPVELRELAEKLAENAHEVWAAQRVADGWTYGPARDDAGKKHPCLIPYGELPESEKAYDRRVSMETLQAIVALGFRIVPPG
jgi:RyR domain